MPVIHEKWGEISCIVVAKAQVPDLRSGELSYLKDSLPFYRLETSEGYVDWTRWPVPHDVEHSETVPPYLVRVTGTARLRRRYWLGKKYSGWTLPVGASVWDMHAEEDCCSERDDLFTLPSVDWCEVSAWSSMLPAMVRYGFGSRSSSGVTMITGFERYQDTGGRDRLEENLMDLTSEIEDNILMDRAEVLYDTRVSSGQINEESWVLTRLKRRLWDLERVLQKRNANGELVFNADHYVKGELKKAIAGVQNSITLLTESGA